MHTLPKGYRLATINAGFRKEQRDDLALLVSDAPAALAGVFTTNIFKAAPVLVGMETVRTRQNARAVIVNSGRANACTGDTGIAKCRAVLDMVAKVTGLQAHEILPMSTGIIGEQLRLELWEKAVPPLAQKLGTANLESFAKAIMTTDAFPKFATAELKLSGGTVRLCGAAKGAGMICPNMATMLAVMFCDAAVDAGRWREMFRRAVDGTFNRVSVDGDTSTNDTLIGLANGLSGVIIREDEFVRFEDAVRDILGNIAYMLVQDGEGATKVLHIRVRGAANPKDAELVARTVGHSPLVKTAMFGRDPNWGRIAAAAGRSGAAFKAEDVDIRLCGVPLLKNGQPTGVDVDAELTGALDQRDIHIEIELGAGNAEYLFLASDLGHDYVSCNADYRT